MIKSTRLLSLFDLGVRSYTITIFFEDRNRQIERNVPHTKYVIGFTLRIVMRFQHLQQEFVDGIVAD